MAGKPKHRFHLQQQANMTWQILAVNANGEEFWHGEYTLAQNAIRWGQSHQIPDRWPQAVLRDEDIFEGSATVNSISLQSKARKRFDESLLAIMQATEVDFSDAEAVSAFTGMPVEMLEEIPDVADGKSMWQPKTM